MVSIEKLPKVFTSLIKAHCYLTYLHIVNKQPSLILASRISYGDTLVRFGSLQLLILRCLKSL
jgi:hypothetical protein